MNIENLLKAADYIETIPQEKFGMGEWREGSKTTHQCDSVGCIIGHCTILDTKENIEKFSDSVFGRINFMSWSEVFFGIHEAAQWSWCFDSDWATVDNTPLGASKRIRYMIKNGVPGNWLNQSLGIDPISY